MARHEQSARNVETSIANCDLFVRGPGGRDLSQVALSAISTGKRKPSLDTLMTRAGFFEVPADRLMTDNFEDLLASVLCDRERYVRVEEKIRPGFAALSPGEEVVIVSGKPIEDETTDR